MSKWIEIKGTDVKRFSELGCVEDKNCDSVISMATVERIYFGEDVHRITIDFSSAASTYFDFIGRGEYQDYANKFRKAMRDINDAEDVHVWVDK